MSDQPTLLVVASHNQNKIREIKELVRDLNFKVVSIGELGDFPEVEEDGTTFKENARKKALETAQHVNQWVLADDSGLEVDILDGAPGVYSARFAGEPGNDGKNNQKLLELLQGVGPEQRGAQFRCVMALASPSGRVEYTEGICRGQIGLFPQGENGFGYDPLFIVPEYGKTFAQLDSELKNKISHRGRAAEQMKKILHAYEKSLNSC